MINRQRALIHIISIKNHFIAFLLKIFGPLWNAHRQFKIYSHALTYWQMRNVTKTNNILSVFSTSTTVLSFFLPKQTKLTQPRRFGWHRHYESPVLNVKSQKPWARKINQKLTTDLDKIQKKLMEAWILTDFLRKRVC